MVREHLLELLLVRGQRVQGLLRHLGEGLVCRGEDCERTRSLQRVNEARRLNGSHQSLEAAGAGSGVDNVCCL